MVTKNTNNAAASKAVVKELTAIRTELEPIMSKMDQALRIRKELTIRRSKLLKNLRSSKGFFTSKKSSEAKIQQSLVELQTCNKNERLFMTIMDTAVPKTIKILSDLKVKYEYSMDADERSLLIILTNMAIYVSDKSTHVKNKLDIEQAFITNPSDVSILESYKLALDKELKYDKAMLIRFNLREMDKKVSLMRQIYAGAGVVGMIGSGMLITDGDLQSIIKSMAGIAVCMLFSIYQWNYNYTVDTIVIESEALSRFTRFSY